MSRTGHAAAAALLALAAACSDSEDAGPVRVTADEQRALADAKAMIPPEERAPPPAATLKSERSPTP